ncbi:MAG: Hsp20/alpha crystallin family protein [Gaiellaceae bacterium]
MGTMLTWSPFEELDSIERRMLEGAGFAPVLLPAADIYETDDEFVMELEVPGYDEKELGIEVFDHTVRVKGERKEAKEEEEKSFHLRERLERKFERRFELPLAADTEHVRAKFATGVLEVHAPKLAISKPHMVEITKA